MKIFITNLGKYTEGYLIGKWVKLPVSEDKLNEVLEAIGINEYYEEYFITDYENEIIGIGDVISEYSSVQALNELAQRLEELSDDEADKLGAVLEYEACRSVSDVLELLDELDNFDLLTDVTDDLIFIIGNEVFFVILIDTDCFQHLVELILAHGELYPFPDEITLGVLSKICNKDFHSSLCLS